MSVNSTYGLGVSDGGGSDVDGDAGRLWSGERLHHLVIVLVGRDQSQSADAILAHDAALLRLELLR